MSPHRPRRSFITLLLVAVIAGLLGLALFWQVRDTSTEGSSARVPRPSGDRIFLSNDPVERACALGPKLLARLWRGFYRKRGGDLILVPHAPNFSGGFVVPGHTGPWDYLQKVPLVLYGPGHVAASGEVRRPASITDVFPTVGALTDVDLPQRTGTVLREALADRPNGVPKLIVTVVWDGAGNNVLARWPDRWPNLKRFAQQGTSFTNATVGSSPSITPATHGSLGTGAFPRDHGVTAINMRRDNGDLITAMVGKDPRDLELTTYGDEVDRALGNSSKVGMLAWKSWHMTMLGHGTQTPGGDADELALIGGGGGIAGNLQWYSMPRFLNGDLGLRTYARRVDREDGKADGEWMGHEVLAMHDNPAWVRYQGHILREMLRRGDYGADQVPDLFLTNFKVTDIVGHQYTMSSDEMGAVLQEQDAELGRLAAYLDRNVGDYVIVVTADHGHTPPWSETGGWPVVIKEVAADIDAHFDVPPGRSLIAMTSPGAFYFDHRTLADLGVSPDEIAELINGYTIRANWPDPDLPEAFVERGEENVFSAAFLRTQMPEIMRCGFGAPRPPAGFPA
ncbi:MAG TPA: alkaline phosphatase family protein [Actinomycetota bacterium]|nr:alkaline phosphatase family protein [Actinomycetota bacterium]